MKIKITPNLFSAEDGYYHLFLNDEHIGFQSKVDTLRKVMTLLKMSECEVEIATPQEVKDIRKGLNKLRKIIE